MWRVLSGQPVHVDAVDCDDGGDGASRHGRSHLPVCCRREFYNNPAQSHTVHDQLPNNCNMNSMI